MILIELTLVLGFFIFIMGAGSKTFLELLSDFINLNCRLTHAGLKVVKPQEALVLTLFGNYTGTIKEPGFTLSIPSA